MTAYLFHGDGEAEGACEGEGKGESAGKRPRSGKGAFHLPTRPDGIERNGKERGGSVAFIGETSC